MRELNIRLKISLIREEQTYFRKDCSTADAIFTLQQVIETHIPQAIGNLETHNAFVDFPKKF